MMLADTNVLVWHPRGYPKVTRRLDLESPVLTGNVKHFSAVEGLKVEAFNP
jgi:predicted nucleic acid-binding protein